jgi:hypothetical protein
LNKVFYIFQGSVWEVRTSLTMSFNIFHGNRSKTVTWSYVLVLCQISTNPRRLKDYASPTFQICHHNHFLGASTSWNIGRRDQKAASRKASTCEGLSQNARHLGWGGMKSSLRASRCLGELRSPVFVEFARVSRESEG